MRFSSYKDTAVLLLPILVKGDLFLPDKVLLG